MVWALDRFLRFARVIYNNRAWSRKNPELSNATVELLSEDMVRLTLRRRFTWIPGQHAYVMLPSISNLPIESHPFTIASIPELHANGPESNVVFLITGRSGLTLRLRNHVIQNGTSTIPAFIDGPYGCPPDLRSFTTCILIAGQRDAFILSSSLDTSIQVVRGFPIYSRFFSISYGGYHI